MNDGWPLLLLAVMAVGPGSSCSEPVGKPRALDRDLLTTDMTQGGINRGWAVGVQLETWW